MSRRTLYFILLGIVVVACGVAAVMYFTRGSHIRVEGAIQQYRTLPVEDNASLAFLDFRITNPADYPFVVKKVTVTITTQDGQKLAGENIAEIDARRIFEFYTNLGQKYNETLLARERIPPKATWDRMIGVRVEAPEAKIRQPKEVRLRIDDVDGAFSELVRGAR